MVILCVSHLFGVSFACLDFSPCSLFLVLYHFWVLFFFIKIGRVSSQIDNLLNKTSKLDSSIRNKTLQFFLEVNVRILQDKQQLQNLCFLVIQLPTTLLWGS